MDAVAEVHAFFEKLPMVIEAQKAAFEGSQGALGLIIEGAGSWTIHFGDAAADNAVDDDVDADADCLAIWTAADFAALLGGEARKPNAIVGDEKLLGRLGSLMLPAAKGALGARLASF